MTLLQEIDCSSLGWQDVYCHYDGDNLVSVYFAWDLKETHNLLPELNQFDVQDLVEYAKKAVGE